MTTETAEFEPVTITLTDAEIKMAEGWDCTPIEFWTHCGEKKAVDLESRRKTVGGLDVIGGLRCLVCGYTSICKGITREASAADAGTTWTLAGGGRSVNCGGIRLRAEGKSKAGDVAALMARIVRLPELEAEIEQLKAELEQLRGGQS
jgi:hypothetical protein